RSPQPRYYLLGEEQPVVAPLPEDRPAVVLHQVSLPSYLDRDALVLRSGGAVRIAVAEYHLWAEPLNKAVPRLLEETMRPLLQEKGLNLLWPDAADAALQVDVALLRLDGGPGGSAEISARWRILGRDGTLLAQGVFTKETDAGDSHESMVRSLSRLLADFGRALALASGGAYERFAGQSRDGAAKKKKER
ncbi:MAG: PqiC family protein, partial [Desulfovibrionaceae bacterium]|nr:PqiC family protein [Desulfovibrionaceae bacterium]